MTRPQPHTRPWFISLRLKLLIGFTLLFSAVFAAAFYWFYTFATAQAGQRIQDDMVGTLINAAESIDGDMLQALYTQAKPRADGYSDDPRYWEHVRWLAKVSAIEPRASLYTYVRGPEANQIIYIGSGWAVRNPPAGVKFLEPFISTGSSLKGLEETTLKLADANGNFGYRDKYGYWISGRTPIYNQKGDKVGALGIDFQADHVLQVQQQISNQVILVFGITYATLFVLVFLVSRTLTRPIVALSRTAERIGEGNYEQNLSALSGGWLRDEMSTLASAFAIMVNKVYQREQTLRHQVEELKIEIDEAKREMAVSEIINTDFFQDLRGKARAMRSRSQANQTPPPPEQERDQAPDQRAAPTAGAASG